MPDLFLTPRELESLNTPFAGNPRNGVLVVQMRLRLDREMLSLTHHELAIVHKCAQDYHGGCERQLRAILSAADRH